MSNANLFSFHTLSSHPDAKFTGVVSLSGETTSFSYQNLSTPSHTPPHPTVSEPHPKLGHGASLDPTEMLAAPKGPHKSYFQVSVGTELIALLNLVAYLESNASYTMEKAQAKLIFQAFELGQQNARLMANQAAEDVQKYSAQIQAGMLQMSLSFAMLGLSIAMGIGSKVAEARAAARQARNPLVTSAPTTSTPTTPAAGTLPAAPAGATGLPGVSAAAMSGATSPIVAPNGPIVGGSTGASTGAQVPVAPSMPAGATADASGPQSHPSQGAAPFAGTAGSVNRRTALSASRASLGDRADAEGIEIEDVEGEDIENLEMSLSMGVGTGRGMEFEDSSLRSDTQGQRSQSRLGAGQLARLSSSDISVSDSAHTSAPPSSVGSLADLRETGAQVQSHAAIVQHPTVEAPLPTSATGSSSPLSASVRSERTNAAVSTRLAAPSETSVAPAAGDALFPPRQVEADAVDVGPVPINVELRPTEGALAPDQPVVARAEIDRTTPLAPIGDREHPALHAASVPITDTHVAPTAQGAALGDPTGATITPPARVEVQTPFPASPEPGDRRDALPTAASAQTAAASAQPASRAPLNAAQSDLTPVPDARPVARNDDRSEASAGAAAAAGSRRPLSAADTRVDSARAEAPDAVQPADFHEAPPRGAVAEERAAPAIDRAMDHERRAPPPRVGSVERPAERESPIASRDEVHPAGLVAGVQPPGERAQALPQAHGDTLQPPTQAGAAVAPLGRRVEGAPDMGSAAPLVSADSPVAPAGAQRARIDVEARAPQQAASTPAVSATAPVHSVSDSAMRSGLGAEAQSPPAPIDAGRARTVSDVNPMLVDGTPVVPQRLSSDQTLSSGTPRGPALGQVAASPNTNAAPAVAALPIDAAGPTPLAAGAAAAGALGQPQGPAQPTGAAISAAAMAPPPGGLGGAPAAPASGGAAPQAAVAAQPNIATKNPRYWYQQLADFTARDGGQAIVEIGKSSANIITQAGQINYLNHVTDIQKAQVAVEAHEKMLETATQLYQSAVSDIAKELQSTLDTIKHIAEQTRKMTSIETK